MTATAAPTRPPDISVVIPARDRGATIDRTLASVTAQHGVTFEVVVVDDGSSDDTGQRADRWAAEDPHVRLVRQEHAGVSAARNAGVRAASGRHLTFLDCDDEAEAGWLASYVAALDAGADLVFAPGRAVRPGHPDRTLAVRPLGPAFGDIDGLFLPGMFAVRRADLLAVGGYAVGLPYSENTELGLRLRAHLARRGHLTTIAYEQSLVVIHLPPTGRSNAARPEALFEGARYLVEEHADLLSRDPAFHASQWAIAGVAAARLDRPADARRHLARALWVEPRNPSQLARLLVACVPAARRRRWPPSAPAPERSDR